MARYCTEEWNGVSQPGRRPARKKSAIYTFERGKAARHPHAALHDDVVRVREALRAWGVRRAPASASMRPIPITGWSMTWR